MTDEPGPVAPDQPNGMAPGRSEWVRRLLRAPAALLGLTLVLLVSGIALLAPVLASGKPYDGANPPLAPPSWANPMGTDIQKQDLFIMVVQGVRVTMTVVACVLVISAVVGITLGLLAGYVGGLVDDAVTRLAEMIQSVPRFFLAFLVIGLYGPGLSKIILVLGLTSWTFLARVCRAETLALRDRPYIEAARACGASRRRIILTHVLPNVLPPLTVVLVLMGSRVILIEAGLAFLGLGAPGEPSLGILARNSQQFLREAWWLSVFPGLGIVAAVLGMNLLSDGLSQALDPRGTHRAAPVRRQLAT